MNTHVTSINILPCGIFREGPVPKKKLPPKNSQSSELGNKLRSLPKKGMGSASVEGRPSSLEGVEIIRAFLKIEHREVREAIIKLVTSFSSLKSGAE